MSGVVKWAKERENMMTWCHNSAFFRPFGRAEGSPYLYTKQAKKSHLFRESACKSLIFRCFLKKTEDLNKKRTKQR